MKILAAVIFGMSSGMAFAADRPVCESRLTTYSFTKLIERSLNKNAVTIQQVAAVAEAQVPFNPLEGVSLNSRNLALHAAFASFLPMSAERWAIEKEELQAVMNQARQTRGIVDDAQIKTAELMAPRLAESFEILGSHAGTGKWFNTKSGQVILGYRNPEGRTEVRDILSKTPMWTSDAEIPNGENWNFGESADGKLNLRILKEIESKRFFSLFDRKPKTASVRAIELPSGTMPPQEVRQIGVAGDHKYYFDSHSVDRLSTEMFQFGSYGFSLPILAASEPIVAVDETEKHLGQNTRRFFFYRFRDGAMKKLNRSPVEREGNAVHSASLALADGSSAFVIYSMDDSRIAFLPPFREQVSMPVVLSRPDSVWIGPRVPRSGPRQCKTTSVQMFATGDSRILVAVAMDCPGGMRVQVFEPMNSVEPIFDQALDRWQVTLNWFEHKGRSFLVTDSATGDTNVFEPLDSQIPVAKFNLSNYKESSLKVFNGPAGQIYLIGIKAGNSTIVAGNPVGDIYKNTVSVFTLFNKEGR